MNEPIISMFLLGDDVIVNTTNTRLTIKNAYGVMKPYEKIITADVNRVRKIKENEIETNNLYIYGKKVITCTK